jgi:hypothetical protein
MYLSIWSKLRENQYKNKLVFISSNSKDFGTIKSIFDPIKHELKDNNIDYVNTLSWGLSKMELNA